MTKSIFAFVFIFFQNTLFAQNNFGNEWLDSNKKYLKIEVNNDGLYQISGAEIINELSFEKKISSSSIQMFHHGIEIALQVIDGGDGIIDQDDEIRFYGLKNTGVRDSLLYKEAKRTNAFQSLFTDNSAYFLSVGDRPGLRIQNVSADNVAGVNYHYADEVIVFNTQYSFNNSIGLLPNLQQSYFEFGEGWTGNIVSMDTSASYYLKINDGLVIDGLQPDLSFQIQGRSWGSHKVIYSIDGVQQSDTLIIDPFGFSVKTIHLEASKVLGNIIELKFTGIKSAEYDWFSLTWFRLRYPQKITSKISNYYTDGISTAQQLVKVYPTDLFYDVTDSNKPKQIVLNTATGSYRNLGHIARISGIKKPLKITTLSFTEYNSNDYNYIIISSKGLKSGAESYASYRKSIAGGGFKTGVFYTEDIYDYFGFGERNPIAITHFMDYMLSDNRSKYLFLLGRGISFPDELKSQQNNDLVPTFGYPASDVLLSAGIQGFNQNVQAAWTGRLSVTQNQQILNYLAKVKEMESQNIASDWKRKALHLSGGQDVLEIQTLGTILQNLSPIARESDLQVEITSRRKLTDEEVEPIDISKELNAGLGLITFVGHGSATEIDLNIGYCSKGNEAFANKGKYPIMFFNGCGVGNAFYKYEPLSTDWLITPDKGAIAVFANSFWSYLFPTQLFLNQFYNKLFVDPSTTGLSLGQIHQQINLGMSDFAANPYVKANMHQIILQGDPALKIFPTEKPDYVIGKNELFIRSKIPSQTIKEAQNLEGVVYIKNNGKVIEGLESQIKVTIREANTEKVQLLSYIPRFKIDTAYFTITKSTNTVNINVELNGNKAIEEYNYENNSSALDIDWNLAASGNVYPLNAQPDKVNPTLLVYFNDKIIENEDYVPGNTNISFILKDENPISKDSSVFQLLLSKCETCQLLPINSSDYNLEQLNSNELKGRLNINLNPGEYRLQVQGKDASGNNSGNPYEVIFIVAEKYVGTTGVVFPNPALDFTQLRYEIVSPVNPDYATLGVFTENGNLLYSKNLLSTVGSNSEYLDLNRFSGGTYFVKLTIFWIDQKEEELVWKVAKP